MNDTSQKCGGTGTRKYAVAIPYSTDYALGHSTLLNAVSEPTKAVEEAELYPSMGQAISAVIKATKRGWIGINIVAVDVYPGETRREVVDLKEKLDGDIKFAVQYPSLGTFLGRSKYGLNRVAQLTTGSLVLTDTLGALVDVLHEARQSWRGHFGEVEGVIVGIREVTTPPTYRISEIG